MGGGCPTYLQSIKDFGIWKTYHQKGIGWGGGFSEKFSELLCWFSFGCGCWLSVGCTPFPGGGGYSFLVGGGGCSFLVVGGNNGLGKSYIIINIRAFTTTLIHSFGYLLLLFLPIFMKKNKLFL